MQENQPNQQFNKRERYELKHQQKLTEQVGSARKKMAKKISKISLVVLLVGGSVSWFIWYAASQPKTPEDDILSKNGIHWHPELTILIKGQKQEISANIGIGVQHKPMHTHDTSGTIHLEMQGLVTKKMVALGQFFENWGKQFNQNCILDFCNGPDGTVKMSVNGQENKEFENYQMQDKDQIEIRYEPR